MFRLTGTEHRVTSAYHPQSNGLTERFNQTLQTTLMKVVNDTQSDWDDHLPAVLFAYRTSIQKTTKLTPFEMMYCRYAINFKYDTYHEFLNSAVFILYVFLIAQQTYSTY